MMYIVSFLLIPEGIVAPSMPPVTSIGTGVCPVQVVVRGTFPGSPGYVGKLGDSLAFHQGAAWAWLKGHFEMAESRIEQNHGFIFERIFHPSLKLRPIRRRPGRIIGRTKINHVHVTFRRFGNENIAGTAREINEFAVSPGFVGEVAPLVRR